MSMRDRKIFVVLLMGAAALAADPSRLRGAQDSRAADPSRPNGAQESLAGAWRLAEVGGRALPLAMEEAGGCREELLAAALTLESGGRWSLVASERETCGGRAREERDEERGTYTVQGGAVAFAEDANDRDDTPDDRAAANDRDGADDARDLDLDDLRSATLSGGALRVVLEDGATAVFRR